MDRLLLILLLSGGFVGKVSGQEGSLTGVIKLQDRPAEGATVIIAGTRLGTVTAVSGIYRIDHIPAGVHELIISLLGYKTVHRQLVIQEGITMLNIVLERDIPELDQVVVTGVSRATRVRENPLPLAVVTSRQIEQTPEPNLMDALAKNVPGLEMVKTGPNVSKPFINGLGYNRVLTLYDGMRVESQQWGDEHGVPVDDYNIEKAEVVKGPASLMYGSDAVAGVVSLFPQVPGEKDSRLKIKYLSEYQSSNGLAGNSLRLAYSNDHWLWALRGSARIARNYSSPVDGRIYNTNFRTLNASAMLGYGWTGGHSRLSWTFYDNLQGIPDGSRDSLSRKFTYQVHETEGENTLPGITDDIKNRPVVPGSVLASYALAPLHQHIRDFRLYADNEIRIGAGNLKVLAGLEQNARQEYNHPTLSAQPGMYVRLTSINYGIRYDAPPIKNTELSFGVNGMYQRNKNGDATDFPIPDYHLFDLGTYAYAKWKQGRWTIAGGVRYDRRNEKGEEMYIKPDVQRGFYQQVSLKDSVGGKQQFPPFALFFEGVSGSVGLTWQWNEHFSIKANLGRGYRAPNITEIASNGLDPGAHIVYLGNLQFRPEFSLQEDLGMEGIFRDWQAGISLFNNDLRQFIYEAQAVDAAGNPIVIIPGNKTFQYRQTTARLYGLETRLRIDPQDWKGFVFDNRFSILYGFNRNPAFDHKGTEGAYLPFIPPARLLSTITQDIATGRKKLPVITVKGEMDWNGTQDRFLGLYGTETATPSYVLINAAVHTTLSVKGRQTLQALVQVNNIFNVAYQSHLSRLKYLEYYAGSPNGRSGIYNMGRNICLRVLLEIR